MKRSSMGAALLLMLLLGLSAVRAQAQGVLTLGAGFGAVLNEDRDLPDTRDDFSHMLLFGQLNIPMSPLSFRADLLFADDPLENSAVAFVGNLMVRFPLPLVTPYVLAGYGKYDYGDDDRSAWSAGAGARLNLGALGIFAEGVRYNTIQTDMITLGLTLTTGR